MGRGGCQDLWSSLSATFWLIATGRLLMNLVTPALPEPQKSHEQPESYVPLPQRGRVPVGGNSP